MSRLSLGLIAIPMVLALSGCMSRGGFPKRPESIKRKLLSLQKSIFCRRRTCSKSTSAKPTKTNVVPPPISWTVKPHHTQAATCRTRRYLA